MGSWIAEESLCWIDQGTLEQSRTNMDILVSTLSSPVSSSGYGSAEEDHSLIIPFPDLSSRRYAPLSPSSDSGSGIFSFTSTSSSSLQSGQDDLLPEALGTIFGDLLEFEQELPHLDLSLGLNFSDNQVIHPTNSEITSERNDHMNDHLNDHINVPNDFDCLSDLYRYFQPDGVDSGDLEGCNYSTNIDPTSSIDLEEETGSEGSEEGPEDRTLVLLHHNTKSPANPLISTESRATEKTSNIYTQTLSKGIPNEVEKLYRPLNDCLEHSTGIDRDEKVPKEIAALHEEEEIKSRDDKSFTLLFELISSGAGKAPPSAFFPEKNPLLGGRASTELSKKELPQVRSPPESTSSTFHQPKQSVSSPAFARGQIRSPDAASPIKTNPSPCTVVNNLRKFVSPSLSHDPTLPSPIPRTAGVRRTHSELDDHRYSTTAPESDSAPPSKSARMSNEVVDTGKSTGSTRVTGNGNRRSEKTILETFLLTTEKLHANKGSDAMLAEDRIARLHSGRHRVLPSVKSSSSASYSTSSSSSSSSSQRSSVLERLLTEKGRIKQESSTNKEDRNSTTTHHRKDTAKDVRHAITANAAATPSVSNPMDSNYEQFENSHFAHDSITLQLGLLSDELNDHVWTPSSVDDKVFSNEMEAIIGQNLNPNDIWMHQYISDLL